MSDPVVIESKSTPSPNIVEALQVLVNALVDRPQNAPLPPPPPPVTLESVSAQVNKLQTQFTLGERRVSNALGVKLQNALDEATVMTMTLWMTLFIIMYFMYMAIMTKLRVIQSLVAHCTTHVLTIAQSETK